MNRLILIAALLGATPALAVPTPVTVRVLSQGAKFIGTGMGGVDDIKPAMQDVAQLPRNAASHLFMGRTRVDDVTRV